jgi:hypothetical protein
MRGGKRGNVEGYIVHINLRIRKEGVLEIVGAKLRKTGGLKLIE